MPFCCQCGTGVGAGDQFCASCGAHQPAAQAPPTPAASHADFASHISPRTAALLCYIPWLGWIAAILVLASQRFKRDHETRFHAFQGLYLFVAWLLVDWVLGPALELTPWEPLPKAGAGILSLLVLIGWVVMIVKVSQSEHYRLPIIGDLAERSVAEQA